MYSELPYPRLLYSTSLRRTEDCGSHLRRTHAESSWTQYLQNRMTAMMTSRPPTTPDTSTIVATYWGRPGDDEPSPPDTCTTHHHNETAQRDLGTGRVATVGGKPTRIAAVHSRSTVFARCVTLHDHARFLGPTSFTISNGSSISSAVFARPMPDSPYTLHTVAPPISPKSCPFPWGNLDPI